MYPSKTITGKDTVFDRIEPLMAYLGNPENKIRAIHIAGTSGKTFEQLTMHQNY